MAENRTHILNLPKGCVTYYAFGACWGLALLKKGARDFQSKKGCIYSYKILFFMIRFLENWLRFKSSYKVKYL